MGVSKYTFVVAILLFSVPGCQPKNAFEPPPIPTVTVANPTVDSIELFIEENGETEAVEQATVSARVQGILEEIKFKPDDKVTEGSILYSIEKSQYKAAVLSAEAAISSAKAELGAIKASIGVAKAKVDAADAEIKVAQAEFDRNDKLLNSKAVSQSEWDEANAALEQSRASRQAADANLLSVEAGVAQADALLEKAIADLKQSELDLEWTDVTAPISGRVERTKVKRGNLVDSGTELVTIIQGEEIWANFNISERLLLELEAGHPDQEDNRDITKFTAFLQRSGDEGFPFKGHLDFADSQIDKATGTLGLRAIFKNDDPANRLLAGMFVRIRVPVGVRENALLLPEKAIAKDQVSTYVYVVGPDNKVERKNIVAGTKHGDQVVIEDGLSASDSVIIEGIQRARPGGQVDPSGI